MQIFHDALSPTTIDVFRKHYDENKDNININHINSHGIDTRTVMLPGSEAFAEVKKLCLKHFPGTEDEQIYANYQRQTKPTFMHVDEYGKDRKQKTWTIIIPMHTDERLGVVLFKEIFNSNEDLKKMVQTFPYDASVKKSNVSQQVTIDHTPFNYKKEDEYLADYLELDGIFKYKIGDYILFDTNQLHCSTNFKVYKEYQHKDLVQIHIGTSSGAGYNPYSVKR
jgi:hypothetical protein